MDKDHIRKTMLRLRRTMTADDVELLSLRIQKNFLASAMFEDVRVLALYSPVHNEVATAEIAVAAITAGKKICYPRVDGRLLQFGEVSSSVELQAGQFGIPEPVIAADSHNPVIDLLLVPGVAFDHQGYRLGYGRGYYDRFLMTAAADTLAVGLCYDFQICDRVPREPHDRRLNWLITETSVISCHDQVTDFT